MRLALDWPITYWSRMVLISAGEGRPALGAAVPSASDWASSRMMSLHNSMHSSQMNTDGPAISLRTSCWLLPQKEQYNSFSLDPFLSVMFAPSGRTDRIAAAPRRVALSRVRPGADQAPSPRL